MVKRKDEYGFIDLKASFIIEFTASFLQEKIKIL